MVVGPSPEPSRYVLRVRGVRHFVRCGADILLTGLRQDVEGEGRCPVCEATIRLHVRDRHVEGLEPPGALLHVVERRRMGRTIVECEPTHLFDRPECLEAWRADREGDGVVETVEEFLRRWTEA